MNSRLDSGSPCFDPFCMSKNVALFVCLYRERFREVHCRCPHFDSPLMAFLFNQSVCCKVVCCLVRFSKASPRTVCTTRAMNKSGGSYSHFPRVLSCVSLYRHFLPVFRREFLSLNNLVEDLSHHFSRLLIKIFNVFGSNSFVVRKVAFFLSLLIAVCNSSVVITGILVVSSVLLS